MSDQPTGPFVIDLSEPKGPMALKDWAALYPKVPIRTISLCLWEANQGVHARDPEAINAAVTHLIVQRLEELWCVPISGQTTGLHCPV
jgi:hypothetical protein